MLLREFSCSLGSRLLSRDSFFWIPEALHFLGVVYWEGGVLLFGLAYSHCLSPYPVWWASLLPAVLHSVSAVFLRYHIWLYSFSHLQILFWFERTGAFLLSCHHTGFRVSRSFRCQGFVLLACFSWICISLLLWSSILLVCCLVWLMRFHARIDCIQNFTFYVVIIIPYSKAVMITVAF